MSKNASLPPQDKIDLYDRLIATNPEIERKGVTNPYTSVNGHMFTHLSRTGTLGIRLPKEEREAFLEKYNTTPYESYGAIMREYVTVPDDLFEDTQTMKDYLEISYAYTSSLKPKPTRKKS